MFEDSHQAHEDEHYKMGLLESNGYPSEYLCINPLYL